MLIEAALLPRNLFNEGNQIHSFILWELLWFHFITVPVRQKVTFRFRFRNIAKNHVLPPIWRLTPQRKICLWKYFLFAMPYFDNRHIFVKEKILLLII